MTTQAEVIASELLAARVPILRETALQIADPQVRYCGTIGGNVANGDPGNDMPAVMLALGAEFRRARALRRAVDPGARLLSGGIHDRARRQRGADRAAHPGAARRPRLRPTRR